MLGDFGEVLVMDWGLAKVLGSTAATPAAGPRVVSARQSEGSGSMTIAGTIMGTPQYMAPEQARGEVETLDPRADIYALGAILFHLLYGRPPVSGHDTMATVEKVGRGEVEWPPGNELRRAPESLLAVCRRTLALDRAKRYQRVEDLQADIAAYQGGFATSAENAGLGKQLILALKRHKVAAGGPADVTVVCVDVPGCEGGAILSTAAQGTVVFFSMATSFSAAALGAEGLAADVTMLVGNGYVPGHAAYALDVLRDYDGVRALFERRLH